MLKKFNLNGISRRDRHLTIDLIQLEIERQEGILLQHQMFSDLQISMLVEIRESKIMDFHNAIKEFLTLSKLSPETVDTDVKKECILFLNVSFSKGRGDLNIEIPHVPG